MPPNSSRRERITKNVILTGVSVAVLLLIGWFVCFGVFVIPSASMANTLVPGDHVLVERIGVLLGRPLYRGEIVVHRYPLDRNQDYVKRIVGVPGDRIQLRNKQLYRNGRKVEEPYTQHSSSLIDSYRDNFPNTPNFPLREPAMEMLEKHVVNSELVVPEGRYFVMGDNRDDSADSRYFGFIQASDVVGRPIVIYGSDDPKRIFKRPR
jgi:signal peptidase I